METVCLLKKKNQATTRKKNGMDITSKGNTGKGVSQRNGTLDQKGNRYIIVFASKNKMIISFCLFFFYVALPSRVVQTVVVCLGVFVILTTCGDCTPFYTANEQTGSVFVCLLETVCRSYSQTSTELQVTA